MTKTSDLLKRSYNAVVTADIVARDQHLLFTDKLNPTRGKSAVHVVAFKVYVAEYADDAPELLHTVEATVPSRRGDSAKYIVNRAAKAMGGVLGHTMWEWELTGGLTELMDELTWWVDKLPEGELGVETLTGFATLPDDFAHYARLYDGDDQRW